MRDNIKRGIAVKTIPGQQKKRDIAAKSDALYKPWGSVLLNYPHALVALEELNPVSPPVAIAVGPYLKDLATPIHPCRALRPAVIIGIN